MFFNVPMAVAQYVERARAAGPMSATVTAS
jgi:hypothetical protein